MAVQQREILEELEDEGYSVEDSDTDDVMASDSDDDHAEERFAADTSGRTLDATQMYLSEIGFSPLLSAEEEIHYARLARKGDELGRRRMIDDGLTDPPGCVGGETEATLRIKLFNGTDQTQVAFFDQIQQ